jgi:hypothetical protein
MVTNQDGECKYKYPCLHEESKLVAMISETGSSATIMTKIENDLTWKQVSF